MRDFKSMKRQRSRNRGGGGGGGGGSGGKPTHNVNRAFDSNGPDGVKIRGHAQHVFEKYQQLARDASASGDRVLAENYMQHAEHYFRVLRAVQPNRPASEIIGRDAFTSGIDIDFEDEGGGEGEGEIQEFTEDGGEARTEQRQDQRGENGGRQEYRQDNRQDSGGRGEYRSDRRPDYNRQDRDNRSEGRQENRTEGRQEPRPDTRPDNRQESRGEGRQDRPEGRRDERGGFREDRRPDRFENRRDDRSFRGDRNEPRGERPSEAGGDSLAVVEPQATPLTSDRRDDNSPLLRSQDGSLSPAPAFLQSRVEAPADDGAPAEPRRRRTRAPRRTDAPAAAEED